MLRNNQYFRIWKYKVSSNLVLVLNFVYLHLFGHKTVPLVQIFNVKGENFKILPVDGRRVPQRWIFNEILVNFSLISCMIRDKSMMNVSKILCIICVTLGRNKSYLKNRLAGMQQILVGSRALLRNIVTFQDFIFWIAQNLGTRLAVQVSTFGLVSLFTTELIQN